MKAVFTFSNPQGMTDLGVLTLCALSKPWVQTSTLGSLSPPFYLSGWQPMPQLHGPAPTIAHANHTQQAYKLLLALKNSWKFEGVQEGQLYLNGVPGRDKRLSLCSQEPLSLWPTKWLTSGAWAQAYLDSPLPGRLSFNTNSTLPAF